jgi:hypothetical protein
VWRDQPSGPGILVNDATPGTISSADYNVWRAHFGQSASSGSTANGNIDVPEPSHAVMLTIGILAQCLRRPADVS